MSATPDRHESAPTLRTSVPTNMVSTAMAHATPPLLRLLRLTERHQKEPRLTQELSASPTNGVIYLPALSEHRPPQEDRFKKKKIATYFLRQFKNCVPPKHTHLGFNTF